MTEMRVGVVDVHVLLPKASGWKVLALQRSANTRCPGAWECVHGHIEGSERPEHAAVREVQEETGLPVSRLYNVTVQPFYLHKISTVQVAVVFAAFVESDNVLLSAEHTRYEWLEVGEARLRFAWPREVAALSDIQHLLASGDAGAVEDVLRVF